MKEIIILGENQKIKRCSERETDIIECALKKLKEICYSGGDHTTCIDIDNLLEAIE